LRLRFYAMVCLAVAMKNMKKRKMHLVQTVLDLPVLRKLDALAKAAGHKRAGYLRHLIEMHVVENDMRRLSIPGSRALQACQTYPKLKKGER
jgi:predicted DNA-binding protein